MYTKEEKERQNHVSIGAMIGRMDIKTSRALISLNVTYFVDNQS